MGLWTRITGRHSEKKTTNPDPEATSKSQRQHRGTGATAQGPSKNGLAQVQHIVAVASGKGGVGKSTTSLALAALLHRRGYKVGLLDADLHGPSLVQMTGTPPAETMLGGLLVPPERGGIKLLSAASFGTPTQAVILRGPMAGNLVRQFLTQVAWGQLDYLFIDYPPGTGDIALTISQAVRLSGAVIVTTPQELALLDVRKAIHMFETLKVPVLGIVETMSRFVCASCNEHHSLFPKAQRPAQMNHLGGVPFHPELARICDQGSFLDQPAIVELAYGKVAEAFLAQMADHQALPSNALETFTLHWQDTAQD